MIFRFSLIPIVLLSLTNCTQVSSPEPTHIQYGGACSDEFSKAYETLMNLPDEADNFAACDHFYSNFTDVKCVSKIDGIELRLHTTDFDKKCHKNVSTEKNKKKTAPVPELPPISSSNSLCTRELTIFIIEKQNEFHSMLEAVNANQYSNDFLFETALAKKKICNQYFFSHKYLECPVADKSYSFYDLKPYCDQFQDILHTLKNKFPKKYSPQELKPVTGLNLKFHFEDAFVPFFKSKQKIKDTYIVDGRLLAFSNITTSQNYCYFESESIRYAGELKKEIYKVDITYPTKSRIIFNYTSFNEQWRLNCHASDHFYLQDLVETLGNKVTVLE